MALHYSRGARSFGRNAHKRVQFNNWQSLNQTYQGNKMSVEIPTDLQPQIAAAIARGSYANEQELVSDILRATVPVLDQYQHLRDAIQESLTEIDQGKLKNADFDAVRNLLNSEFDESGKRK